MKMTDRRRHPRVPDTTRLRVRVGNSLRNRQTYEAKCVDLSCGGIRCSGTLPLRDPGDQATVILRTPSRVLARQLHVPATVQWVDSRRSEWVFRFESTDAGTAKRLRSCVARAFRDQGRRLPPKDAGTAEAFRMLESSLGPGPEIGSRVVLVTSSISGEGKDLVASGIATALAQAGQRVLLVDADLYRPSLHHSLGLRSNPGVAELLETGTVKGLDGLIQEWKDGIDVIAASAHVAALSELYATGNVTKMIGVLRGMGYRTIVVASPPLLSTAGASQLARCADDVLLAVRSTLTRERDLARVRSVLEQAGVSLRGVVFNDQSEPRDRGTAIRSSSMRSSMEGVAAGPESRPGITVTKNKRKGLALILRM